MRSQLFRRSPSSRSGITLLEVLVSIGVVGIGLIGVASLIPLAHFKAAQGINYDRQALYGKRAYREFKIRGLDRPGVVRNLDQLGSAPQNVTVDPLWVWPNAMDMFQIYRRQTGQDGRLIRQTYVLDPLLVSATGTQVVRFPIEGSLFVPRVTLLSSRPEQMRRVLGLTRQQMAQSLLTNTPYMTYQQAESEFMLQDDVVVDIPENKNEPPSIAYLENNRRYAQGSLSWLAMLVPDSVVPTAPNSDRYTLSIVVIRQRFLPPQPLAVTGAPLDLLMAREEVVANAQVISGTFGDIKSIYAEEMTPLPSPPDKDKLGLRHLGRGDWVLLAQVPPGLNFPIMKWYRVVSADELEGDWDQNRKLSLSGPDWNIDPDPNRPLYLIHLRGVETVYEKTVRLHDSSMYAE